MENLKVDTRAVKSAVRTEIVWVDTPGDMLVGTRVSCLACEMVGWRADC